MMTWRGPPVVILCLTALATDYRLTVEFRR